MIPLVNALGWDAVGQAICLMLHSNSECFFTAMPNITPSLNIFAHFLPHSSRKGRVGSQMCVFTSQPIYFTPHNVWGFGNTSYHSHYPGPNPKNMAGVEPCGLACSKSICKNPMCMVTFFSDCPQRLLKCNSPFLRPCELSLMMSPSPPMLLFPQCLYNPEPRCAWVFS